MPTSSIPVEEVFPSSSENTPQSSDDHELTPVPVIVPKHSTVVEPRKDPDLIIEEATKAAKALQKVVKQAGLSVNLGGKNNHLMFEAWQTIGAFNNATSRIVWTKRIENNGMFIGYEAKAEVVKNGQVIASAESMCTKDEPNWNNRKGTNVPEFQLRSMAQTRASAKALRTAFAWVAVLAGYSPTPLEEMVGNEYQPSSPPQSEEDASIQKVLSNSSLCPKCQTGHLKIIPAGISKKTGKSYTSFLACDNRSCKYTQKL